MKSFIAKRVISYLVNLRYLRFKLLKYKENNKKICNTFDHNFKNIPLYIMSNVSLERYYFVLYDGALTLKMSKMALNAFCDKTLHIFGIGMDFIRLKLWQLLLSVSVKIKTTTHKLTIITVGYLSTSSTKQEEEKKIKFWNIGLKVFCLLNPLQRFAYTKLEQAIEVLFCPSPESKTQYRQLIIDHFQSNFKV